MTKPYRLYHATFAHAPSLESGLVICPNSLIGVDSRGSIDYVRPNLPPHSDVVGIFKSERPGDEFEFVDYYTNQPQKFLAPGFIDTHIHASQYPNIGVGLGVPLLQWLQDYTFALEKRFSHPEEKLELAQSVYRKVVSRTLSSGTTCASYFTTIDLSTSQLMARILAELGQRGYVGKVCMDCNDTDTTYQEPAEQCLHNMHQLVDYCKQYSQINPIVTPRFAPVCTRDLLTQLGELSKKHNLPIQTHISENTNECQLVADQFPECSNYASVYHDHNLLTPQTILAHAIHLSDAECKLIKQQHCSISHCPTSNSFISSGEAPIHKYLYDYKINVSLGTDVSGGYDSSILAVMKHAIIVSHHLAMKSSDKVNLSVADVFYMATQGGAVAVSQQDDLGTFEIGKQFDAQLIDLGTTNSNVDVFEWQLPLATLSLDDQRTKIVDLINKWVFSGDDRNCTKVWVSGKTVVDKQNDKWVVV